MKAAGILLLEEYLSSGKTRYHSRFYFLMNKFRLFIITPDNTYYTFEHLTSVD